jgi:prepilin-type N-terminal cleavage/methylation domain-containing protein
MMKKTGFTLAEVLITLSIIGIVAMMTLPALMTNVQEQQAKTGLKKGLNTVIEAAQMSQAIEGFAYDTLTSNNTGENDASLTGLLIQRTQYDPQKSDFNVGADGALAFQKGADGTLVDATAANIVMFFRDGSALSYPQDIVGIANRNLTQTDGLAQGFVVLYDINGTKAPNRLSNCLGNTGATGSDANGAGGYDGGIANGGARNTQDNAGQGADAACTKAQRVIKDQFLIRLRGTFAQPEGNAAWWAFNH